MKRKYIYILIMIVIITGCFKSPLDLDADRKITPVKKDSVQLSLVGFQVKLNGFDENYSIDNAMLEIDTSVSPLKIWGNITVSSLQSGTEKNYPCLSTITLILNNMNISGSPELLNGEISGGSYIRFKIERSNQSYFDTIVSSDLLINQSRISFSLDKESEVLWIYVDGKLSLKNLLLNDSTGAILDNKEFLILDSKFNLKY